MVFDDSSFYLYQIQKRPDPFYLECKINNSKYMNVWCSKASLGEGWHAPKFEGVWKLHCHYFILYCIWEAMLGVKSEKSFLNCKTYILELDLCKRIFFICNNKFVWFDAEFDGIHMLLNIEKTYLMMPSIPYFAIHCNYTL